MGLRSDNTGGAPDIQPIASANDYVNRETVDRSVLMLLTILRETWEEGR